MTVLQKLIDWKNELPSIRSWEINQPNQYSPHCNRIYISLTEGNLRRAIVISTLDYSSMRIPVPEYICIRIQRDLIEKLNKENNFELSKD